MSLKDFEYGIETEDDTYTGTLQAENEDKAEALLMSKIRILEAEKGTGLILDSWVTRKALPKPNMTNDQWLQAVNRIIDSLEGSRDEYGSRIISQYYAYDDALKELCELVGRDFEEFSEK